MNPKLIANSAINGFKALGGDIQKTITGAGVPLTYALRDSDTRRKMDQIMRNSNGPRQYGPQEKLTVGPLDGYSGKRVAATAATAYVAGDAAYRTLSGGSAYRTHEGEENIVGIPFI